MVWVWVVVTLLILHMCHPIVVAIVPVSEENRDLG
jgi:hypothetical protein